MSFTLKKNYLSYVVVEFTSEKSLAIVPSIWLKEDYSYWPPYTTDAKNKSASKRKEIPTSNWSLFPIKEWAQAENWDDANKILGKLEYTSCVESTDTETGRSKRKRFVKHVSSDASESSDSSSPAQKSKKRCTTNSGVVSNGRSFKPPPLPLLELHHDSSIDDLSDNEEVAHPPVYSTPRFKGNDSLCSGVVDVLQSSTTSTPTSFRPTAAVLEPVFEKIFRQLEEIKSELKLLRSENSVRKTVNSPIFPDMLPLFTESAVREFERKALQLDFKEKVVEHLTAFNGRSMAEAGRNMLRAIFSNDIAITYNLSGKGSSEKRSFQGLQLYKLLFAALRKLYSGVTEKEYRLVVVNWLDGAKDRNGRRKFREKPKTPII